jgi:polysaccharide biosynthesis/export protein ExoF
VRRKITSMAIIAASIGTAGVYAHVTATDARGDTLCSAASQEGEAEKKLQTSTDAVQIGDKVNLAVFEHIVHQEDKWGPQPVAPDLSRSFVQRAELSGERIVQENGVLSLPFLGQIPAEGCTTGDLEKGVARAFEQVFHRPAFVTVLSVEHNPVFIVGPVKNPGSYKYSIGMTVLHAIALSGGIERFQEGWMAIEAAREESRTEHLRLNTTRVLARAAVLRGERDAAGAVIPAQLVELVGKAAAAAAVDDEKVLRSLALSTRQARESALRSAAANAASEVQAAQMRLPSLDASIKLRSERLQAITSLNANGIASKAQLADVQTALVDMEARKQDAMAAVAAAKQKLDQANAELKAFDLEYRSQRELEISTAEREILENWENMATSRGIIKTMQPQSEVTAAKQSTLVFEIHRHSSNGISIIQADEITELKPGDLVRVKAGANGPAPVNTNTYINVAGK